MDKILISACLVGENVRYDAGHCQIQSSLIARWGAEGRLVPICPEMAGGLPAPRPPCEIHQGQVIDANKNDWTAEFNSGAKQSLKMVEKYQIKYAVLKEQSPSCGSTRIYDGSFQSRKTPGMGITAALLKNHGVQLFSEENFEQLDQLLE